MGAVYCFGGQAMRLGLSPGLDFETSYLRVPGRAESLRREWSQK